MNQSRVSSSKMKDGHKARRPRQKKRSQNILQKQQIQTPSNLNQKSGPSCLSVKSDLGEAPKLTTEPDGWSTCSRKQQMQKSSKSSPPSCLSLKCDRSKGDAPYLTTEMNHQTQESSEYSPSCLSMSSQWSKGKSPNFELSEPAWNQTTETCSDEHLTDLNSIFQFLQEKMWSFVTTELKNFYTLLSPEYPESLEHQKNDHKDEYNSRELLLEMTKNFLKTMKQETLAENLQKKSEFRLCQDKLKSNLQQKFECIFEGIAKAGNPTLLNKIYTELIITEGGSSEVNQEHEVRQIETASRKQGKPETAIKCEDIFIGPADTDGPIRTVLTKGVAGIGKTVVTQKFSLNWAEGKDNQDIQLLFLFTFRALNELKEREFSLMQLVHHFFSETKKICSFEGLQVVFILDGLDECRLPLDFTQTKDLNDPTESSSVDVLLVNLIRGSLLPSARLWITTRPAAANQIPAECVSMVTEVQGFRDPQKEQYFRKRFKSKKADTIISHIKMSRSLHIMCYMPVFCWITATVLDVLKNRERGKLPKTLTQMYIHFLVVQAKVKNIKYEKGSETDPNWTPETRKMVESLGKLAFEQLQKGNLFFYESDLRQCGLEPKEASVYSGVFTQIFREEPGLYQDKVYCFVHLSVQEFLAAFHVHQIFFNKGHNLLADKPTTFSWLRHYIFGSSPLELYQTAIDQALKSSNGHLDLFLRFLLGLSLSTNQSLLQGLMTQTENRSQISQETAEYIKKKMSEDMSAERSISLLHCLNELNDHSLVEQIQQYLRKGHLSEGGLSPAQWSALAFILLSSGKHLDVFELKKYSASEEALMRLLPVVKASNKALLSNCNLSERSCEALSSVLSSKDCHVKLLDLSDNDLTDSGVKMLTNGLMDSHHSALVQLRLVDCNLSEGSCEALSSVLALESCCLKELDLSRNDLQNSGLKMLCVGLKSPHCKLKTLRLSKCLISEEGCASLASALSSNPSHLRDLDLSYNHPGETGGKLLSALRKDHSCTVRLKPTGIQWLRPLTKYFCKATFDPNTAHLRLKLSADCKTVTYVKTEQLYQKNKNRFNHWPQLLCSKELSGRYYWEVEWSGEVSVAVCYKNIRRKGDNNLTLFGRNAESWSLSCSEQHYNVCHNNIQTRLPYSPSSSSGRVAVYVDCAAGSLSFYTVCSDKLIHLHTFNTTFRDTPLIPGFRLKTKKSTVTLCDLTE